MALFSGDEKRDWVKLLLYLYRNPFAKAVWAEDVVPLANSELASKLGISKSELQRAADYLKVLGLAKIEDVEARYEKGEYEEPDNKYLLLTEKGLDTALRLEEHFDAERNNKSIEILTIILAIAPLGTYLVTSGLFNAANILLVT